MKYIKYMSNSNTVGLEDNIESYWEIDQDGYVIRCIEVLAEGKLLKYDETHEADAYNQLPEGIITDDNLKDTSYGECQVLTQDEFEVMWSKAAINFN